jgi:hypothetical protein
MKYSVIILLLSLISCGSDLNEVKCYALGCSEEAIVKDITGLDGCSIVLELKNGRLLIPERRTYIQAPTKEEDPLYYFDLRAGQSVHVSYVESLAMTTCMAGKVVFLTCITGFDKPEQ